MPQLVLFAGLNPYCIGWYSLGGVYFTVVANGIVLILIVLDGILWDDKYRGIIFRSKGLNPYCIGWYSLGKTIRGTSSNGKS